MQDELQGPRQLSPIPGGLGVNGWKAELSWTVNWSSSRWSQGGHTSSTVNWGFEVVVPRNWGRWNPRLLLTEPQKLCSVAQSHSVGPLKLAQIQGDEEPRIYSPLIYSIPEPQSCFAEWAVCGYPFHPHPSQRHSQSLPRQDWDITRTTEHLNR